MTGYFLGLVVSFTSSDGANEKPCRSIPTRGPFDHSLTCSMHTRYCVTYFSPATACVNTREHTSARQCQGHCRGQHRQNTDAAPLRACPPPKTTHGVPTTRTAIHTNVRFHISYVSVRRPTLHSSLLYCDWHAEFSAPTQPHRYLSHSSLSASRYHPHFASHNADGNQMPTQRCHTGCPASTARQSNRERKRVS